MSSASTLTAISLPDPDAERRYNFLCGLDDVKTELLIAIRVALARKEFDGWASAQDGLREVLESVAARPQLFILGGDVGSGKTELAQTVGDAVARDAGLSVTLFTLSLAARGTGFVGEMTQRIVDAFDEVRQWGQKRSGISARAGAIFFIDEADAIAQSRALSQMHHEDRAGVNALIRGIDDLSKARVPVAIIMATNRLNSIDPAIRRRAALEFSFARPNEQQREALYRKLFPKWSDETIARLAAAQSDQRMSFSYSDIVQRIVPRAVLNAFNRNTPVSAENILEAVERTPPTPPFDEDE
jgi:AAA+ superfamily predicted ATPase